MTGKPNTAQFFISYAREDKAFAMKLRRGLAARGRLAWLDLKNIGALAPWRKEIGAAIDAADVFVFILSPDAVTSAACRSELRLAVEGKKRLAPLVWRDVDAKTVPAALQVPNWLFVRLREGIDGLVDRLVKAADRDPDWIRDHSRLLTRAREWLQHRRDPSRLLSGQGLQDALRWLAESGRRGDRALSRLHAEFIEASRVADAAAAARQRELYLKALARQLAAQSELTRGSAEYAVETPALLAIESLRRWPTVEGDRALRRSLTLVPRPPLVRHKHPRVAAVAMARGGGVFAIGVRTMLQLVEVASGAVVWRVRLGLRAERVEFGAGDATIVVRGADGVVQVHRSTDGVRLGRCRPGAGMDMIALHPEGTSIAAAGSLRKGPLQVWPLGSEGSPFTVELEDEPAAIGLVDNFLVAVTGSSPTGHTRVLAWNIGVEEPPRILWERYGRPLRAAIADDGDWVAVTVFAFGSGPPSEICVGALALRLADPEAAETMTRLAHDDAVDHFEGDGLGRLLAFTHRGNAVHVWEPRFARLIARYRVRNQAYCAALAADGRFLVVAHRDAKDLRSGGQISLVNSDGDVLFTAPAEDLASGVACDANYHISVSTGRHLTLWDADTASALRQAHAAQFTSLVFSADAKHLLVKAPENGSLVVPADRTKPAIHLDQTGSIWTQVFAGNEAQHVVTVGNPSYGTNPAGDPHLRLWDVARAVPLALRRRIELAPIAITRDGRKMATMAAGGAVLVRRIADGRLERRFASEDKVAELFFDAAGTHLAVVLPDSVRVWRIADGASVATLAIQKSRLLGGFDVTQDLALLRDSYASSGSVVRLTDGRTIVEHAGRPHLDFARRRIACVSGEQKIEVRELNNEQPLMNAFHEGVVSLELSPDGAHLVSAGTDGSARVWQLADGAELARLEHPDRVLDTCFSPDSRLIATVCSDDIVRLWTWRADDLIAEGQSRIPRRLSNAELDSFLPDPETRM